MENSWLLDESEFHSKTLKEVKDYLKGMPKRKLIKLARKSGIIWHVAKSEIVGGVVFRLRKNGTVHFSKSVKEPILMP